MGLRDLLHLNSMRYERQIKTLSKPELEARLQRQTRLMTAASWGVVAGAGSVFYTLGISILGCVYSGRNFYIAIRKFNMLKDVWNSQGLGEFNPRIRDIVGPLAIGVATMFMGVEIGMVLRNGLELGAELVIGLMNSNPHGIAATAERGNSWMARMMNKAMGRKRMIRART